MKQSVLILLLSVVYTASAQDRATVPLAVEAESLHTALYQNSAYAIPGCRILIDANRRIQEYVQAHPEVLHQQRLMKRAAWSFNVGDPGPIQNSGWWASDVSVSPTEEYLVPSTCRAVGANSYIFVEDALWNDGSVTQAGVDSILAAWESRTPADPNKGIYETDVETFGNPPNVDSDNRIILLILDIVDGFSGSGGYVAGYFYSINQVPDGTQGHRSNEAEIYYIDGEQANLTTPSGISSASSTTAHEFQHMINWNYNSSPDNIDTFSNESQSEVASLVCGYSYPGQNLYTNNTDISLFGWNSTLADYSRAARWGLYLWNQFPNDFLKLWVQGNGTSIQRINNALPLYTPATSRQFTDIFIDWVIANEVQDQSVDPRYDYTYSSSLTKPQSVAYPSPEIGPINASVNPLSADYISFTAGTGLNITFTSASANLVIRAIKTGAGASVVESVTLGEEYSEPDFGTTYSKISFVIASISPVQSAQYSYTASGSGGTNIVELNWDETEPIGYLQLDPFDTVAVVFPAVPGARLDSVRVALRRPGTMNGGVWNASQSGPSPFGTPLALPISVSTTLNPVVLNPGAEFPYEIPYPNWRTIDLRSYNIILDNSFVVGFWHSANPSTDAAVMVTTYESATAYNNFAYLHNNDTPENDAGWYFLSAGEGEIFLFLIRAYAGFGGDTVSPAPPPGSDVPETYVLVQNYPNPFNAGTYISYGIPQPGHVKLQIFDVLGRVVATLVDGQQAAGTYNNIQWSGTNSDGVPVSSGMYFYRLESGSHSEIKRMIVLR